MYRFVGALLLIINCVYSHHGCGFGHDFGPGHDFDLGPGPDFGPGHHPDWSNHPGWDHNHDHSFDSSSEDSSESNESVDDCHHTKLTDFERLAQYMAAANKILRNICNQALNMKTRAILGTESYSLKYSLQGFSENSIDVKVKNGILSVTATQPSLENFKDLRILPDFVKVSDADWYLEDGILRISFPYKSPLKTEFASSCNETDNSVFNLPKKVGLINDLRFLGVNIVPKKI